MLPHLAIHAGSALPAPQAVWLAKAAEAAGLHSVWLSEDLFFRAPVATAGAIAVATERVPIGFGVLTPYNRHPSLMAMDLVSLCELAPGRVIYGLGAGVEARVVRMGMAYGKPVIAVRETIDLLRGLLAGGSVTLHGEVQRAEDLALSVPVPAPEVPIYVAAVGPRALAQAGRIADGVVLSLMCSPAHAAWASARAREGAAAAGREIDLPIVAYLPMAVDDDGEAARSRMRRVLAYYLARWAPIDSLRRLFTDWSSLSDADASTIASQLGTGASPDDVIPDVMLNEFAVAGTLDDCRAQLARFREAGVTVAAIDAGADLERHPALIEALGRLTTETRVPDPALAHARR